MDTVYIITRQRGTTGSAVLSHPYETIVRKTFEEVLRDLEKLSVLYKEDGWNKEVVIEEYKSDRDDDIPIVWYPDPSVKVTIVHSYTKWFFIEERIKVKSQRI